MFKLTRGEELTALIAAVLVAIAIAVVCFSRGERPKMIEIPLNRTSEIAVEQHREKAEGRIVVHISGEVRREGLLELSAGSRMEDAVNLAGPTEDADLQALNLAAPLVDGERIVVPNKRMAGQRVGVSPRASTGVGLDVNLATQQELEALPGIGPTLAGRIIELRKTKKFENVDDLLQVRGIGPVTLEKI
jgi:competence protein ComEA